ncbi:MAG: ComF family protein [Calditrichia bacterium]
MLERMHNLILSHLLRAYRDVEQLLLPSGCVHCLRLVEGSIHPAICLSCLAELQPLHPAFGEHRILSRLRPCYIDSVEIFWAFDDVLRDAVHALKYCAMPKLGTALGEFAARQRPELIVGLGEVVVCAIPLHRVRMRRRGYNQSALIAGGVFGEHALLNTSLLLRKKNTVTQTNLSRNERRKNVMNAFALNDAETVFGKTVVLIDDVLTTGATLNSCARLLKKAGAAKVVGIALASPLSAELD